LHFERFCQNAREDPYLLGLLTRFTGKQNKLILVHLFSNFVVFVFFGFA
jgi:hypothetical protein